MAAIGYARSTGKTGVCIATSGPGATNLITGLADAMMDSVPVVAVTGQVSSAFIGTDAFQEIDVLGLSLACTKHSFRNVHQYRTRTARLRQRKGFCHDGGQLIQRFDQEAVFGAVRVRYWWTFLKIFRLRRENLPRIWFR